MEIAPGSWEENTKYTIDCKLFFQDEPSINGSSTMSFNTYAPPKNGTVNIFPDYGYIGDTFLIMVDGYVDKQAVLFNVFKAEDEEGTLKGAQLNNRTIPQTIDYRYKATSTNPVIVDVVNSIGEKSTTVLYPWIVAIPDPICETEIVCPPEPEPEPVPEPSNNTTNTTDSSNSTDQLNTTETDSPKDPITEPTTPPADGRRLQARPSGPPVTSGNETTNNTDIAPCEYVTTCVQPEYDFTQPRPPFGPQEDTSSNETIPVDNQTDPDSGRRLSQSEEDLCQKFSTSSDLTEALAVFDQSGQICILESILTSDNQKQVLEKL